MRVPSESAAPCPVVGESAFRSRGEVAALVVMVLAGLGWAVYRQAWSVAAMILVMLLVSGIQAAIRRGTVVDEAGIRRVGRRGIAWIDVDVVEEPAAPSRWARLHLVDGSSVNLPGVRSNRSADVALVGHKEIRPQPVVRRVAAGPALSQEQADADITRRSQRLAEQRAELEEQNWRYRRAHPDLAGPDSST